MPHAAAGFRSETAAVFLDAVIGRGEFSEQHRRVVRAPAEGVWEAVLEITPREIRLLAPFMSIRSIPSLLRRPRRVRGLLDDRTPVVEAIRRRGFVELHRDAEFVDGRAYVVYGVAGRFWSPAGNDPVPLDGLDAFVDYDEPRMAKGVLSIEVVDCGHVTELTTETRVVGTDATARRAFARYWMLIRGPSGLIRRSWLAAVDRRAARGRQP